MILFELFITFFKIGLFTFGGGYAMLPLIQEEVLAKKWSTNAELLDFIAVSESTPGPFAINISTFIGSEMSGILGSVCATLGVVLPSFIVILIVAQFFDKFKNNGIVKGCMSGLKPAVIGLIGAAIISVGKEVFFPDASKIDSVFSADAINKIISVIGNSFTSPVFYIQFGIFAVMAVAAFKKLHPILIICISAAVGIATGFALNLPI